MSGLFLRGLLFVVIIGAAVLVVWVVYELREAG